MNILLHWLMKLINSFIIVGNIISYNIIPPCAIVYWSADSSTSLRPAQLQLHFKSASTLMNSDNLNLCTDLIWIYAPPCTPSRTAHSYRWFPSGRRSLAVALDLQLSLSFAPPPHSSPALGCGDLGLGSSPPTLCLSLLSPATPCCLLCGPNVMPSSDASRSRQLQTILYWMWLDATGGHRPLWPRRPGLFSRSLLRILSLLSSVPTRGSRSVWTNHSRVYFMLAAAWRAVSCSTAASWLYPEPRLFPVNNSIYELKV